MNLKIIYNNTNNINEFILLFYFLKTQVYKIDVLEYLQNIQNQNEQTYINLLKRIKLLIERINKFKKIFILKSICCKIVIATEDIFITSMLYGIMKFISQGITNKFNLDQSDIIIQTEFLKEKTDINLSIDLEIKILNFIKLILDFRR